jgi:hypothetical protein
MLVKMGLPCAYNAAAMLALAGLPSAPYGEVANEQLAAAITKLLRAMNSEALRAEAVQEVEQADRWSQGGRTEDYLAQRVPEFIALLVAAKKGGHEVVWG